MRKKSWGVRIFLVLLVVLGALVAAARFDLALIPPHTVFVPSGTLGDERKKQLEEAVADAMLTDRDHAIELALDFTTRSLTPSLGHAPSFDFGGTGSRGAGASEYAEMFVAAFEVAAKHAGSTARAFRVSSGVRVFGKPVPLFADHDWVLVVDPADGARIPLDPALADLFLGSNLSRNVKRGDAIVLPK